MAKQVAVSSGGDLLDATAIYLNPWSDFCGDISPLPSVRYLVIEICVER